MKNKKNILIVGGAGYIGRRFCKIYSDKYFIDVIDTFWFSQKKIPNVNAYKMNISIVNQDKLLKKNYYCVIILSGLSNDPMANLSPDLNFEHNNYAISSFLLKLSKSKVKKVIFGSSCSVYGNTNGRMANEKSEIKVEYPYGISKYLIDQYIDLLNKNQPYVSFYSLRQGTVCGYSPRMRFDLVINKMVRDAITNAKINIIGNNTWRPILDIEDACKTYDLIIKKDIPKGIYNIFSYNITVNDIAQKIKNFFKTKNLDIIIEKNLKIKEKRNYKASRKKISSYLDFKFKSIEQTILEIYLEIKKIKNINSDSYTNIYHFKKIFKK